MEKQATVNYFVVGPPDGCQKKNMVAGGGVGLEERLDVVGCSPIRLVPKYKLPWLRS